MKKEDLQPWDGTTPETWHKYPVEKNAFPLFINSTGTVYYLDLNGEFQIWCARSQLRSHLTRLFQLGVIPG